MLSNYLSSSKPMIVRKAFLTALAFSTTALIPMTALAGPEGGQVTAGSGTISQNGANTTINQSSQNLAINWQSFNVDSHESVRFNQPNSSSIALNRILGQSPSQILGNVSANGQVFIMNPNGVLFGQGSQVNVGGLVASTLDISDEDFMAGNHRFSNNGADGAVINKGTINAAEGGYIALVGPDLRNDGTLSARMGKIVMAAGDEVSLSLDQGSLVSYSVDKGTLHALAENSQVVQADGGAIYMTAKAADDIGTAVVNNTGIIEARTVQNQGGVIVLGGAGTDSQVTNSGRIDASAQDGKGGKVTATAKRVVIDQGSEIDASGAHGGGEVYIGGGWQGQDAQIANADVTIVQPDAHIDVSAKQSGNGGTAVLWSEEFTGFAGKIDAAGGTESGNGGQVETSSRGTLDAVGLVNTGAVAGEAGDWLVDPYNIFIEETGASGTVYAPNYVPTENSTILDSSIVSSLNAGTNLLITTNSPGANNGNITVNADIAKTGSAASTLTLEAFGDIIINAAISSDPTAKNQNVNGRLNVVLTADSDNAGGGNLYFGSGGSVTTYNGNFIAGAGDIGSVTTRGGNMTMAQGSFIDVGRGVLEINMNGTVELHENSLRATNSTYYPQYYLNNNTPRYNQNNYISVRGNAITTANSDDAIADIVTSADTRLTAGTIGSTLEPIKISGPDDPYGLIAEPVYNSNTFNSIGRTLYINNTSGSSYVDHMGVQIFKTVDITVGNQTNATQNIQIMDDPGGTGTDGTGHIIVKNNGIGVTLIGTGDINTAGVPGNNTGNWATSTDPSVFPTNVSLNSPHLYFENNSVNTGGYVSYFYQGVGSYYSQGWGMTNYSAYFSANSPVIESAYPDTMPDIHAITLNLTGENIGTAANPLDIGSGATLNINNTGGSTYVESEDNSFSTINLTNVKAVGTHYVHFSGGDHIDYLTDGSKVYVPTIALNGCADTTSCGMDVTDNNRNISMTANNGDIVFADNAVNTGSGSFSATLSSGNNEGNILAENDYNSAAELAQITAGHVTFNVNNNTAPGTIGGGNKHIQLAQGAGATDNTLTIYTQQGDVNIHELTNNHFKTFNVTLNSASAAQNILIDLNGPDHIDFSDDGTMVTIDATKVNLSDNNRNWNLNTPSRTIEIDSTSIGSGYYTVIAGQRLRLDGDVVTNDGAINLRGGSGIDLLRSVSVDSNSDDTGSSGSINMNGVLSGINDGFTFLADSSSDTATGGLINMYGGANNSAGSYLSAFTLTSAGANANSSQDGVIYLRDSYFLDGNFSVTGDTYLQTSLTIDTEQGDDDHAGNITFAGRNLTSSTSYTHTMNSSTNAAGMNAGNVDLYGTYNHSVLTPRALIITATGGAGGLGGVISLPAISTTVNNGTNTQSYTGGIITLNGDLRTDRGAVTLNGDTRLANNIIIDTWAAPTSVQNGTAGSVTISGAGVSALTDGYDLTIDTSTNTGGGQYNGIANFTQNAGSVSLVAGNAGGSYVDTLTVNTTSNGTHNVGSDAAIVLNDVATDGTQSYTGAQTSLQGDISTNGGDIDFSNVSALALTGNSSLVTDRAGGTNNAGTLNLAAHTINGNHSLLIDVTADGGGASQDFSLNQMGNITPLASLDVIAANLSVDGSLETAGALTLEARGASSDLTLNSTVTNDSGLITLAAGRHFLNNNALDTGIVTNTGRYLVYATHPDDALENMTGYNKHYNQTYTRGTVPAYASADNWFLYSFAPTIFVAPDPITLDFGQPLENVTVTYTGFIDNDTENDVGITGTAEFDAPTTPGTHDMEYASGLLNAMGYQFADDVASVSELTIKARPNATPGSNTIGGLPNGDTLVPQYTAVIQSATSPNNGTQTTAESSQSDGGTPINASPNIEGGGALQLGSVTIENGGMRLPQGISGANNNGENESDDDEE